MSEPENIGEGLALWLCTSCEDALREARERIAALEMPDTTSELANQRALAIIDAIREGRK